MCAPSRTRNTWRPHRPQRMPCPKDPQRRHTQHTELPVPGEAGAMPRTADQADLRQTRPQSGTQEAGTGQGHWLLDGSHCVSSKCARNTHCPCRQVRHRHACPWQSQAKGRRWGPWHRVAPAAPQPPSPADASRPALEKSPWAVPGLLEDTAHDSALLFLVGVFVQVSSSKDDSERDSVTCNRTATEQDLAGPPRQTAPTAT